MFSSRVTLQMSLRAIGQIGFFHYRGKMLNLLLDFPLSLPQGVALLSSTLLSLSCSCLQVKENSLSTAADGKELTVPQHKSTDTPHHHQYCTQADTTILSHPEHRMCIFRYHFWRCGHIHMYWTSRHRIDPETLPKPSMYSSIGSLTTKDIASLSEDRPQQSGQTKTSSRFYDRYCPDHKVIKGETCPSICPGCWFRNLSTRPMRKRRDVKGYEFEPEILLGFGWE